jgi:hypothetical protein
VKLTLSIFHVVKRTRCGAWVEGYGQRHFVLDAARKKFAHPTKEEAFQGYQARKRRQCAILRWKLARAEKARELTPESEAAYF